jgi:hypothetical protein
LIKTNHTSQFEVTGHYVLPKRGAFVIGHLLGGGKWLGEQISTGDEPPSLTVSGVDFMCNTKANKYSQALVFREQPSLEFLQRIFPVGTILRVSQNMG